METQPISVIKSFGIINLEPCRKKKDPKTTLKKSTNIKKPLLNPNKRDSQSPENPESPSNLKCQVFSPSPTKLPRNYDKENNPECKILTQGKSIDEMSLLAPQKLVKYSELAKDLKKVTRKTSASFIVNKNCEKNMIGNNIIKNISNLSKNLMTKTMTNNFESPRKPNNQSTPEIEKNKHKIFTPVLTGKKLKTQHLGVSHHCKQVSLFDTTQNKNKSTSESCDSLKEPCKTEGSCFLTENSPLRNKDLCFETYLDQNFSSPIQTIQILSPEEQIFEVTPDDLRQEYKRYMVLSPDIIRNKYKFDDFQAPRKRIETFSPESHGFTLSSSSEQEIISDISSLEANTCFKDREIQTDMNYEQIIQLLNDANVVNSLKTLGKITEILMVMGTQHNK
ncbi:hypothetical protein SteCoe_17881 [Stentor coeruleus]|uniref:Uncharacterized protein n=1 Tax=Stentor coeruleus TaxID=5963 RepID=A0A1R2BXT6_9CILI|nr:hypothetical protein SteCoe_17881 [Stentor coeruleus]